MPRARFALVYVLPLLYSIGLVARGPWTWLVVVYVFGLIPLMDRWLPGAGATAAAAADGAADAMPRESRGHDLLLELWAPVQIGMLVWTLVAIRQAPPSGHEWVGLACSAGLLSGGGGINIAHELMHRSRALHRGLGELLMTSSFYAHFCVEHVLGHHRRVATPADPATARRGETVYAFFVRAIAGSLVHAWQLEGRRVQKLGGAWTLRDRRLRMALTQSLLLGGLAVLAGPVGLAFYLAQALFAVLLLESVDYIEHYGLTRRELEPGRFERVQPHHSWNSSHPVSSAHLFQVTHHSDHHANASRPYHRLRSLPGGAPVLPGGYPAMMLTALVPPLFFRRVDPLLDALSEPQSEPQSGPQSGPPSGPLPGPLGRG